MGSLQGEVGDAGGGQIGEQGLWMGKQQAEGERLEDSNTWCEGCDAGCLKVRSSKEWGI